LALGSALHLALELSHTPEKQFDLTDAARIFKTEFSRIIHDEEVFIKYPEMRKSEAEGIEMLALYEHGLKIGTINPNVRAVEREFTIPFNGIEIVGKIDKEEGLSNGGYSVVDYKSGGKEPDAWFLDHNLQFTTYAWAGKILYDKLPDKLVWHHLRTGKQLETTRTDEDIEELKEMIRNTKFMYDNGIRYRVYHEQVCGWCEFSGMGMNKSTICDDRELERELVNGTKVST
jgi:CRISPR/Cas system-associated exonuclease Cas4 (RecB family)